MPRSASRTARLSAEVSCSPLVAWALALSSAMSWAEEPEAPEELGKLEEPEKRNEREEKLEEARNSQEPQETYEPE